MLEIDRLKKNQKEGILVSIIGIVFLIIGLFAYSITEFRTSDVIGGPIALVSRPYAFIGVFLMILGIVEIIVGIICIVHYDNKIRNHQIQFSNKNPQGKYYQNPQKDLVDCPNCNRQVIEGTHFCPNCGAKMMI